MTNLEWVVEPDVREAALQRGGSRWTQGRALRGVEHVELEHRDRQIRLPILPIIAFQIHPAYALLVVTSMLTAIAGDHVRQAGVDL
jgi:hypothetical protein